MDKPRSLADRLSEPQQALLGTLLAVLVPGVEGALDYLDGRFVTGRLHELDDVRSALARGAVGPGSGAELEAVAASLVHAWSEAPPGSSERRWFTTLRAWAWEALLCDPSYGGNRDGRGWHRFGYVGHPKSVAEEQGW